MSGRSFVVVSVVFTSVVVVVVGPPPRPLSYATRPQLTAILKADLAGLTPVQVGCTMELVKDLVPSTAARTPPPPRKMRSQFNFQYGILLSSFTPTIFPVFFLSELFISEQ